MVRHNDSLVINGTVASDFENKTIRTALVSLSFRVYPECTSLQAYGNILFVNALDVYGREQMTEERADPLASGICADFCTHPCASATKMIGGERESGWTDGEG